MADSDEAHPRVAAAVATASFLRREPHRKQGLIDDFTKMPARYYAGDEQPVEKQGAAKAQAFRMLFVRASADVELNVSRDHIAPRSNSLVERKRVGGVVDSLSDFMDAAAPSMPSPRGSMNMKQGLVSYSLVDAGQLRSKSCTTATGLLAKMRSASEDVGAGDSDGGGAGTNPKDKLARQLSRQLSKQPSRRCLKPPPADNTTAPQSPNQPQTQLSAVEGGDRLQHSASKGSLSLARTTSPSIRLSLDDSLDELVSAKERLGVTPPGADTDAMRRTSSKRLSFARTLPLGAGFEDPARDPSREAGASPAGSDVPERASSSRRRPPLTFAPCTATATDDADDDDDDGARGHGALRRAASVQLRSSSTTQLGAAPAALPSNSLSRRSDSQPPAVAPSSTSNLRRSNSQSPAISPSSISILQRSDPQTPTTAASSRALRRSTSQSPSIALSPFNSMVRRSNSQSPLTGGGLRGVDDAMYATLLESSSSAGGGKAAADVDDRRDSRRCTSQSGSPPGAPGSSGEPTRMRQRSPSSRLATQTAGQGGGGAEDSEPRQRCSLSSLPLLARSSTVNGLGANRMLVRLPSSKASLNDGILGSSLDQVLDSALCALQSDRGLISPRGSSKAADLSWEQGLVDGGVGAARGSVGGADGGARGVLKRMASAKVVAQDSPFSSLRKTSMNEPAAAGGSGNMMLQHSASVTKQGNLSKLMSAGAAIKEPSPPLSPRRPGMPGPGAAGGGGMRRAISINKQGLSSALEPSPPLSPASPKSRHASMTSRLASEDIGVQNC